MGLRPIVAGVAAGLRLALLLFVCAAANAQTVRYAYDDANRLAQVTAPDGKAARYTYDSAGRLAVTERDLNPRGGQPQTLVSYHRYDAANRVISIAHVRRSADWNFLVAGQAIVRGAGGTVQGIDTFRSGIYDVSNGQFTGIPAVAQAFEYDGNARLTRERRTKNGATIDTRYEYDTVGNRKTKTVVAPTGTESTQYMYDSADRLIEERTLLDSGNEWIVYYSWDGNGNLAGKTEPGRDPVSVRSPEPPDRLARGRHGGPGASRGSERQLCIRCARQSGAQEGRR
jgi:YD repeat-containing protein